MLIIRPLLAMPFACSCFPKATASGGDEHPGIVPYLPRTEDLGQAKIGRVFAPKAEGGEDTAVLEQDKIRPAEVAVRRMLR